MRQLFVSLVVITFFLSTGLSANTVPATSSATAASDEINHARLQIPFIKNIGQADADVAFYADTFGGAVVVKKEGELELVVPLRKKDGHAVIGEAFVEAKIKTITGASPAVTKVSYFLGNDPKDWHSSIPTYEAVLLADVYEGVELELKAYANNVEKLFYVSPGADPALIRVRVSGARSVEVTEGGFLELDTNDCIVHYSSPEAYQIINGEKHTVEVAYRVTGDTYSFELGDYDTSKELVIDPLLQSTYFGGSGGDTILDLGIAPNGNVYAVGYTSSTDISGFPSARGGTDAFVAAFNPSLTQLRGVAYFGGDPASGNANFDEARTVAFRPDTLSNDYDVYIAGVTASPDLAGVNSESADPAFGDGTSGEYEGFVSWLNSDLTLLHRSTYYGGAIPESVGGDPNDSINAIAINKDGVFITGMTQATDIPLVTPTPVTPPTQGAFGGGNSDAFIAQLSFDLTGITSATYLGGEGDDEARDIVLDSATAFIAGHTSSTVFPGTAGVFQDTKAGGDDGTTDAFVTETSLSLSGAVVSTYIGGTGNENVQALANTGSGVSDNLVYLAGIPTSADFPGTSTATFAAPNNNFVAYINKDLAAATDFQATYLGGNGDDLLWDLALYRQASAFDINTDSVYVTGSTRSSGFPGNAQGEQEFIAGTEDAFIMRIDTTLTDAATFQMTYLGGTESNGEFGYAIAVDAINGVYVGGVTTAADFPGRTDGAIATYSDGGDGFVSRHGLTLQYLAEIRVSPTTPIDFGDIYAEHGSSTEELISIINADPDNNLIISSIVLSDTANYTLTVDVQDSSCGSATVNYVVKPGENCTVTVKFNPQSGSADPFNAAVTISSNDFDEAEKIVTLTGTGGTDSDGIPDREESGPSGNDASYDGNGDGIADLAQASAASLHSQNDAFYVTIATSNSNLRLENVATIPAPAALPENIQTPFGYYSYAVSGLAAPGDSATVTFFLNSTGMQTLTGDEEPDGFWKYGPQPTDPATTSWYEFTFDSVTGTGAEVDLNTVTLSFTDGLRGDSDLAANGTIADPGAPVKIKAATIVPVVDGGGGGGGGYALLLMLLATGPMVLVYRQRIQMKRVG